MRVEERTLLTPWLEACDLVFEAKPKIVEFTSESYPKSGPLYQIQMPPVFDPPSMAGNASSFQRHPELSERAKSLGFGWNEDGWIHNFPTPASFNAMLKAEHEPEVGFRLSYAKYNSIEPPLGRWLNGYLDGRLMIHVGDISFYKSTLENLVEGQSHRGLERHLVLVAHDISVHALNCHRIPLQCIRDIAERIRTQLPNRASPNLPEDSLIPLTLSMFFDNDLNRYCYEIMNVSADKTAFTENFQNPKNFGQVITGLEIRIQETLEGKGDVPSQDTAEMDDLTPVLFDVSNQA